MALLAQLRAGGLGAPVLPDDGMVNRLAGPAVPEHRGFALVGDAHRPDVPGGQARAGQRLPRRGQLAAPDFHRVVLDPARPGIDLRQLLLGQRHHAAFFVKHNASRTGGSLIEGEKIGHGVLGRLVWGWVRGMSISQPKWDYCGVASCPPHANRYPARALKRGRG